MLSAAKSENPHSKLTNFHEICKRSEERRDDCNWTRILLLCSLISLSYISQYSACCCRWPSRLAIPISGSWSGWGTPSWGWDDRCGRYRFPPGPGHTLLHVVRAHFSISHLHQGRQCQGKIPETSILGLPRILVQFGLCQSLCSSTFTY